MSEVICVAPGALEVVREALAKEQNADDLALWLEVNGISNSSYTYDLWFGASASNAASSGDVGGNPNLSNPSGINPANYVPLAGSLAHGAGTPTYAPATDYFGNPRSPTSTDIGAALVP